MIEVCEVESCSEPGRDDVLFGVLEVATCRACAREFEDGAEALREEAAELEATQRATSAVRFSNGVDPEGLLALAELFTYHAEEEHAFRLKVRAVWELYCSGGVE